MNEAEEMDETSQRVWTQWNLKLSISLFAFFLTPTLSRSMQMVSCEGRISYSNSFLNTDMNVSIGWHKF